MYEGHLTSIAGDAKERIADFVHGDDGFGNTGAPTVSTKPVFGTSAAEFIVQSANAFPGEVTVVALASATSVALALRLDRVAVTENLQSVVHLGGAFFTNGNVNPAAEANVFGDPDAADELYGSGADVTVVGLDVTQRLRLSEADLAAMRDEGNISSAPCDNPFAPEHGSFLHAISEFYMAFHVRTTGFRDFHARPGGGGPGVRPRALRHETRPRAGGDEGAVQGADGAGHRGQGVEFPERVGRGGATRHRRGAGRGRGEGHGVVPRTLRDRKVEARAVRV